MICWTMTVSIDLLPADMKRILLRGVLLLATLCLVTSVNAAEPDVAAKQILDASKPGAEREAVIAAHAGRAGEIMAAMVSDLQPGTPEEYKRIPWIWRVAIAAGKRNNP